MNKDVIIIGAGGHGKVIADIIRLNNDNVAGYLDDRDSSFFPDFNILGQVKDILKYADGKTLFIIAIGNNDTRRKIAEEYSGIIEDNWYTAIHPTAILAQDTEIGAGTAVMAAAVINPGARIKSHCIINTGAIIEHDDFISDFVHISPNATVAGTVNIGSNSWIGAGAVICNNISISKNCVIGAGSTVIKDISVSGTYVGSPARKIK